MSQGHFRKKFWSIIILSAMCLTTFGLCKGICYSKTNDKKPKKTKVTLVRNLLTKIDLKNLINLSDVIIEGEVIKTTPSDWANVLKTPLSDTDIKITKIFRGVPYNKKEITVRTNYGVLNGTNNVPEDSSVFKKHEKVLLFLALDDSDMIQPDKNYYIMLGAPQGIFRIKTSVQASRSSNQSIIINGKNINLSYLPTLINKSVEKNYHYNGKSLSQIKRGHIEKLRQNQKLYKKYLDAKNFVVMY